MTIPSQTTPLIHIDAAAQDRASNEWYEFFQTLSVGGAALLSGVGAPSGAIGVDGDFYINTATSEIYGPKTAGSWGSPTSMIGATGPTGPAGAIGPQGAQGQPGQDGIDGADGAPGASGSAGATGPAGPAGVDGATVLMIQGRDGEDGQESYITLATPGGSIAPKRTIGMVFDGGGSPPTVGSVGYVVAQLNGVIDQWTLVSDAIGSAVIDVWKAAGAIPTVANTIAGSEKPTLSSQQLNSDIALSTWVTPVSVGDVFGFVVDAASTLTRLTIEIRITESA